MGSIVKTRQLATAITVFSQFAIQHTGICADIPAEQLMTRESKLTCARDKASAGGTIGHGEWVPSASRTPGDPPSMRCENDTLGHSETTVLVADDNADLRELLAHQLRKMGAQVIQAANGQEAVTLALEHHPALVLMDLEMPVMGGLDAAAELRKCGYGGVIVAFTAHEDGPRTQSALACGCNAVLKKPLSATKLRMRLTEYLGLRAGSVVS